MQGVRFYNCRELIKERTSVACITSPKLRLLRRRCRLPRSDNEGNWCALFLLEGQGIFIYLPMNLQNVNGFKFITLSIKTRHNCLSGPEKVGFNC